MNAMNHAWNLLKALRREPEPEPEEEFDPSTFNYGDALSQIMRERAGLPRTTNPHEKGRRDRAFDEAMARLNEQAQQAQIYQTNLANPHHIEGKTEPEPESEPEPASEPPRPKRRQVGPYRGTPRRRGDRNE